MGRRTGFGGPEGPEYWDTPMGPRHRDMAQATGPDAAPAKSPPECPPGVGCCRCRIIETRKADAIRLYGAAPAWKNGGQRLLDDMSTVAGNRFR